MKVLLLGDSIRLGYSPYVANSLGCSHTVYSANDNGRFTLYTLRYLHEWVKECEGDIDVVHWNNGLWDVARRTLDDKPITALSCYRHNLRRIITEIYGLCPFAKIVFALTTPVHPKHPFICNTDIETMNKAARDIMSGYHIAIDDLHALVKDNPTYISDDFIHLTPSGYQTLGRTVAECCLNAYQRSSEDCWF